jgi:hypothetical protein
LAKFEGKKCRIDLVDGLPYNMLCKDLWKKKNTAEETSIMVPFLFSQFYFHDDFLGHFHGSIMHLGKAEISYHYRILSIFII